MDLLQTFVFDDSQHEVRIIRNEEDEPLFRASDMGKVLGMKNIHMSILDFDEEESYISSTYTAFGNKDITYLTEQGVYKLLLRSRKPIAKPFQKWVFKIIKQIRQTGKYEMQSKLEDMQKKCDAEVRIAKDSVDEIAHRANVKGCDKRNVVYYGKIKTMDDGTILLKIGSTHDIKQRLTGLLAEFGQMAVINTFECDRHVDFEKFLQKHEYIAPLQYTTEINGQKVSSEVFRISSIQLEKFVNIASRNVSRFRNKDNKRDIDEVVETNHTVKRLCSALGIQPENKKVNESKRGHCTTIGRKVQQYSSDTHELLKTFDQVIDVVRFKQYSDFSRTGVSNACEDRTIYKGYRWAYLDRDLDDSTIQDIGENVIKIELRQGHVATLSPDKSKVTDVYRSMRELGLSLGYKGGDAVCKRMKKGHTLNDGRHIIQWKEVSVELQDKWLESNSLPIIKPNHVSISIVQLDKITGDKIKTFKTMNDVVVAFGITPRTLRKSINGNLVLKGFKWKYNGN